MTRAVVATICMFVVATSPALAQTQAIADRPVSTVPAAPKPVPARIDLSPQAAGIERIVALDMRSRVHADGKVFPAAAQTTQPAKKKSTWKTPWPYVAIAGIGVAAFYGLWWVFGSED